MWNQLLRKWFGLPEPICQTCEILRDQLDESNRERKELLHKLLEKDKPEPLPLTTETPVPLTPPYLPWRVRQQMLEREDREAARVMKNRTKEIEELERHLGVDRDASEVSRSIPIHAGDSSRNEAEKGPGTIGIRS